MSETYADKLGIGDRYKKKKGFSFIKTFNELYDRLVSGDEEEKKKQKTSMLKRNAKKGTA
jgi:hypothetical protein